MSATVPPRSPDLAWRELHERATAPYKASGRFGWHFARGKLGHDPAFLGIVSRGLIGAERTRMLDIGSGQSLFANLLHSAAQLQREARWPAQWPPLPASAQYTGIELMPKDVARAQAAVGHIKPAPQIVCGNMCTAALPACDVVVILDVLHYVDHAAQAEVLTRVREALRRGAPERGAVPGRLLLRVGDAASTRGFAISQWVDRTVTRIRGHKVSPTWGRTLGQWIELLTTLGFSVRPIPMSEGTPFANVLLVADVAQAPA